MRTNRRTHHILPLLVAAGVGGVAVVASPGAWAEGALSPRDIMDKVAVTRKLDGSESVIKMTLVDEKGGKREREITSATKLFDAGKTEKRVFRFLSPAEVQGTGFLIFDYEAKADDAWIYLPAMRKTRRILSSQGAQSFMGSEFSYADFNTPALDDYNYTLVKEESVGGEPCYVVDAVPKSKETATADGYSKRTYWVSKSKFVPLKVLHYGVDGKLLKELIASDVKLLDAKKKRYRSLKNEMINKQNGRRSIFEFTKMSFAPGTKDEYFTPTYIERG
jgi:outer membrane lipoprotein-sorting protein